MQDPNEGIELLYTRDCKAWPEALVNLKQALAELEITEEIKVIPIDTMEQALTYCFFASPTIHINGQDVDKQSRRTHKRGLGHGRPYFYDGKSFFVPSVDMIKQTINELYNFDK